MPEEFVLVPGMFVQVQNVRAIVPEEWVKVSGEIAQVMSLL
ncbi:hypothetical protein SAMN05421788_104133 [Filimonas lacunae]|uniref:Uncharacterized protein n=1 Tax=Filimonas lacunae TaxID=477680 RepID=A0A173M9C5_9BACT|nr:hypothetical protein FLA_0112 [Filimonas lacunae]SIT15124.1 hypothetical protein SAMN05421788_104133 [Filimonas lacunae]